MQRWKSHTFPSLYFSLFCSVHLRNKLQRNIGREGSHSTESREMWIQLDREAPPRKLSLQLLLSVMGKPHKGQPRFSLPHLQHTAYLQGSSKNTRSVQVCATKPDRTNLIAVLQSTQQDPVQAATFPKRKRERKTKTERELTRSVVCP